MKILFYPKVQMNHNLVTDLFFVRYLTQIADKEEERVGRRESGLF